MNLAPPARDDGAMSVDVRDGEWHRKRTCKTSTVTWWNVFHGTGGGGLKGERNGRYRDGRFTCEAIAGRGLSGWVKAMAQFAKGIA